MRKYQNKLYCLQKLVQLRQGEVERLQKEVADKRRLQERYRRNIEQINALCEQSGASGAKHDVVQALNCASYKKTLMQLALTQQQDLTACEADTAMSWQPLRAATLRRETMAQARDTVLSDVKRERLRRDQKHTDEFARLAWLRTRGQ